MKCFVQTFTGMKTRILVVSLLIKQHSYHVFILCRSTITYLLKQIHFKEVVIFFMASESINCIKPDCCLYKRMQFKILQNTSRQLFALLSKMDYSVQITR